MHCLIKKLYLLQVLVLLNNVASTIQGIPERSCGNMTLKPPFTNPNSSLLNHLLLCKSEKLYFRTSIGLFEISSIDYTNKLLTVSHNVSSASAFVSPTHLSAGFPLNSRPNSLILFDCSKQSSTRLHFPCNSTELSGLKQLVRGFRSCSVIDDAGKVEKSFHPKDSNCTHYSRVYKTVGKFLLGTRISYDIPDHVPNPCDECEKHDGNCGVGLRCVCHPKLCSESQPSRNFRSQVMFLRVNLFDSLHCRG